MTRRMKTEHRIRFLRLVSGMNRLISEIREDHPESQYYLVGGCLNILSGDSHEGSRCSARRDRVLVSTTLDRSGGGDW